MIGNNSCGTHSLLAGKTVDNVEELRILLYDGTQMTVGATNDAEFDTHHRAGRAPRRDLLQAASHSRPICRSDSRALSANSRGVFPAITSIELLPENGFNVARSLVGTEGTCVDRARGQAQTHSQSAASHAGRPWISRMLFWPPITFRKF